MFNMLRGLWNAFLKIIEVYIPVLSFCVMFVAFIVEIFFRYVLKDPLTWPFEVTTIGFLWTVLFGAIYAMHHRDHIMFSLIYDVMRPRAQRVTRIFSNGLVFIGLGIAVYPSYKYIAFSHMQKTGVFQIPFNIIYAPFLLTLLMVMYYTLIDLVRDIRGLPVEEYKVSPSEEGGSPQ